MRNSDGRSARPFPEWSELRGCRFEAVQEPGSNFITLYTFVPERLRRAVMTPLIARIAPS